MFEVTSWIIYFKKRKKRRRSGSTETAFGEKAAFTSVYLLEALKSQRHEVTLKRKITHCTSSWINVCCGRDCARCFWERLHKSLLNSFLYRSELLSQVRRLCSFSHDITSLLFISFLFLTRE